MKPSNTRRSLRTPLSLLLSIFLTGLLAGCGLNFDWLVKRTETVTPVEPPKPCEIALEEKKEELRGAFDNRRPADSVVTLIQSADPKCGHEEELFLYALRLGRYDVDALLAMTYAVYRGQFFPGGHDEFAIWRDQVRRTDLVDRLLHAIWRKDRLVRAGRIPPDEYAADVRKILDFFSWFMSSRLPDANALARTGVDPATLEIPELRLLTNSFPTFFIYLTRYAEHDLLGNRANFEAMEVRLSDALVTPERACEFISGLRMSGLSLLEIGDGNILQTGEEIGSAGLFGPTTSPAFVRNLKSDRIMDRLLLLVPKDSRVPHEEWTSEATYLLKPMAIRPDFTPVVESLFRERLAKREDPARKVFRRLGKVNEEELQPTVRIHFREPRTFRVVGRLDSGWLEDTARTCGAELNIMVRMP